MIYLEPSHEVLADKVEFFNTPKERARGLLKYSEAPQKFAAVFDLPFFGFFPLVHTLGMKFSIDILFCDREKVVSHIYRSVSPSRFVMPLSNAFGGCKYLVEFSSADTSKVRVGDRLSWEAA